MKPSVYQRERCVMYKVKCINELKVIKRNQATNRTGFSYHLYFMDLLPQKSPHDIFSKLKGNHRVLRIFGANKTQGILTIL